MEAFRNKVTIFGQSKLIHYKTNLMKIGLLLCDHVNESLLHIAGDYEQMFTGLFRDIAPDWEFIPYEVCKSVFPADVNECDAYICTGSRFSVYDEEDWIQELKKFYVAVSESDRFLVGVCFGHQMIGEALGGIVSKSNYGWCVGIHSFTTVKHEKWMEPALSEFNLLMMCQDQIRQLPPDAVLLAQNEACPHAMIRIGQKILGIQAHPEFPKAYDQALMEMRIERIGEARVAAGVESLSLPVHSGIIAQWIVQFVKFSV